MSCSSLEDLQPALWSPTVLVHYHNGELPAQVDLVHPQSEISIAVSDPGQLNIACPANGSKHLGDDPLQRR